MPKSEQDFIDNAVLSMLFKGINGSGKSIASGGKEFRPVYFFDFEDRIRSVINYYRRIDGHAKDIVWDTFAMGSSYQDIDKQMDALINMCPYKTVVASSLTSFIHTILKYLIHTKSLSKKQSGAQAGKRIGGIPVNEIEDYNAEDAAIIFDLIDFFMQLKGKGINIILEAHISPYEVTLLEEGARVQQTIFQILTKGKKAPAQIPGYFDEVYLFEKKYGMIAGGGAAYTFNSVGNSTTDCKTSHGIKGFDFTDKDFSVELMKQLGKEVLEAPRIDPNAPKKVSF